MSGLAVPPAGIVDQLLDQGDDGLGLFPEWLLRVTSQGHHEEIT
jgi:hypothetical protein